MSIKKVEQIPLEEEYKKKTGITPQDISKLRQWLDTQPHLPADHITDLDIILTYHCCGRSSEVTKQLLDLHYTVRTLFGGFFKDRKLDHKIKIALGVMLLTVLPTRTPDDFNVFFTHFIERDAKNFVLGDAFRTGLMIMDIWQYQNGTSPGLLMVMDLDGMTLGHLAKLDIQNIQQFLYYLQEALLVNLKGLHFLNAPSFMDRIMMLLRPFLNKTLLSILHIHQVGAKTMDRFFPMEMLPTGAMGGKGKKIGDLAADDLSRMVAASDYFLEENKKRVVEARRPGKPKTITDIFGGIEGSFKKLDID